MLSGSLSGRPELEPVWRGSARAPSRLRRRRAASTSSGVLPARSAGWSSDPPRSRSACTTRHLPWYIARCVAVQPLSASARRGRACEWQAAAPASRSARATSGSPRDAAACRGVTPCDPGASISARLDPATRDAHARTSSAVPTRAACRSAASAARAAATAPGAGISSARRTLMSDALRDTDHRHAFFFFCEKRKKFDLFVAHDVETRRHACTCTVRLRY